MSPVSYHDQADLLHSVVIVLVDFPDQPMKPGHDAAHFDKLFFRPGGVGFGSVSEYYSDVSNRNISLIGDVAGPFRMPRPKTAYANGDAGRGGRFGTIRPNSRDLGNDALTAAVSRFPDLGPYDNDQNGFVDAFIVVHAGSGAEQSGDLIDIWSVKWIIPAARVVGNASVYGFLTIPEDAQVGVCAHELGHLIFGWPDLYDTDSSSEGIGNWCLMSGGTWGGTPAGSKPCHPSAWCKANQKWVTVVNEISNRTVTLQDVKINRNIHRLWTNGDERSKEYFLLENRQLSGYDTSLPGPGLLSKSSLIRPVIPTHSCFSSYASHANGPTPSTVWHIDDAIDSNANEAHRKVDLMQADGLAQLSNNGAGRGDNGDPYPGSSGNHSFTFRTNPSSHDYAGHDTRVGVSKISTSGSGSGVVISADLAVR
jgi:immune inhibitor A